MLNTTANAPVPSKNMQTRYPPPSGVKDALCPETYKKSIFRCMRILFFELLMILFTIFKCY